MKKFLICFLTVVLALGIAFVAAYFGSKKFQSWTDEHIFGKTQVAKEVVADDDSKGQIGELQQEIIRLTAERDEALKAKAEAEQNHDKSVKEYDNKIKLLESEIRRLNDIVAGNKEGKHYISEMLAERDPRDALRITPINSEVALGTYKRQVVLIQLDDMSFDYMTLHVPDEENAYISDIEVRFFDSISGLCVVRLSNYFGVFDPSIKDFKQVEQGNLMSDFIRVEGAKGSSGKFLFHSHFNQETKVYQFDSTTGEIKLLLNKPLDELDNLSVINKTDEAYIVIGCGRAENNTKIFKFKVETGLEEIIDLSEQSIGNFTFDFMNCTDIDSYNDNFLNNSLLLDDNKILIVSFDIYGKILVLNLQEKKVEQSFDHGWINFALTEDDGNYIKIGDEIYYNKITHQLSTEKGE